MNKCNKCGSCYNCRVKEFKNKVEVEFLSEVFKQQSDGDVLPDMNEYTEIPHHGPHSFKERYLDEVDMTQVDEGQAYTDSTNNANQNSNAVDSSMVQQTTEVACASSCNSDDSTTMDETSMVLLSKSEDDPKEKAAVTPDKTSSDPPKTVTLHGGRMRFYFGNEKQVEMFQSPPYPLQPVDVAEDEICSLCGRCGQECMRVRFGHFCVELLLRSYYQNKETYNEDNAKNVFFTGFLVASDFWFYLKNKKRSVKPQPISSLPRCMEELDLAYALDMIKFCQWEEKMRKTIGCMHKKPKNEDKNETIGEEEV